jgi:REP element-mobilizing transposase RayT
MKSNHIRKSFIEIGKIYFWTATIKNWISLLEEDKFKEIIVSSMNHLWMKKKIEIYAFVIMPTHLHFIWQLLEMNGKESPHKSFLKYTAHAFENHLIHKDIEMLKLFTVDAKNKEYEFWIRDSLAFELLKQETICQKLEYIHNNPLSGRWNLCKDPIDYYYSSARFYETGIDDFGFLKNIQDVI